MKGNEGKCHLFLSTDETVQVNLSNAHIINTKCEKPLLIIDCKLRFDDHAENMCKTTGAKIKCTSHSSTLYEYRKKRLIMNAFSSSQFLLCPLTLIFLSRSLNHKINRLHERCFCVVYKDSL